MLLQQSYYELGILLVHLFILQKVLAPRRVKDVVNVLALNASSLCLQGQGCHFWPHLHADFEDDSFDFQVCGVDQLNALFLHLLLRIEQMDFKQSSPFQYILYLAHYPNFYQYHHCFFILMNTQELACIICTLLPSQPVESDCCGRIFCQGCLNQLSRLNKACPICRTETIKYRRSKAIQRLLSELQKECEQCGKKIKIKEYKSHSKFCALRTLKCRYCNQIISKSQFLSHLKLSHQQKFIQDYVATLEDELIKNSAKCTNSHNMDLVLAGGSYGCQVCFQCYTGVRYKLLKCLTCFQTRCVTCFSLKAKVCQKGHKLSWMRTKPKSYFGGARCDECKTSINAERGFMHCEECKFDIDRLCFQS